MPLLLRVQPRNHKHHSLSDPIQFSSVQLLSRVRLFATPWIAACQASLSIANSRSSLRLMSIKSVMPSSHLILCHPLLLLPPIHPSIRVFSNESTLRMRCWRRLLRVPWTARRFSQSILKETSPGCSLEGLMLKLKLQYFGHLMRRSHYLGLNKLAVSRQGNTPSSWVVICQTKEF